LYLTSEEEKILEGEYGEGLKKAMEILVAIGKIYDADKLIPIASAHISGVSFYNIGEAGLNFLREFTRGLKVSVKSTLNPSGIDRDRWREMGINKEFVYKQKEIIRIFKDMGVDIILSCTPYLAGNKPEKGVHIAWSESSAVAYANSVLGAMTNRESGISALSASILGKTPNYGMHIKEERRPTIRVKVKVDIRDESGFGVLGYILSNKIDDEIPWIEGLRNIDLNKLKILSASIATYTGLSIFHIPGVTAEWRDFERPVEVVEIDEKDFKDGYEYLRDSFKKVDLIWLGCPHASLDELKKIFNLLRDKKVKTNLWITTSKVVWKKAMELGIIRGIEDSGAKVFSDTCIAVSPLKNRFRNMVTNSAKGCYYARGLNRFKVKVMSLEKCIETALKGYVDT